MTAEEIETLRRRLLARRELLERSAQTDGMLAAALGQNLKTAVSRVDAALERIEAGTYGVCRRCGRPMEKTGLSVIPDADRCGPCLFYP